tara:strand:- start:720 stop:1265 length:546 start_codon:yes stop_codon:yes gene_type:complete
MNYLDIIIIVSVLYALIKGISNGLINEVSSLISLLTGVYVAINFSEFLRPFIKDYISNNSQYIPIISFIILFLVVVISIKTIGFFLDKIIKLLALGVVSRLLGGVFGMLKAVVFFSFILFFTEEYNLINKKTKEDSISYKILTKCTTVITLQLKNPNNILEKIDAGIRSSKNKIEKNINQE